MKKFYIHFVALFVGLFLPALVLAAPLQAGVKSGFPLSQKDFLLKNYHEIAISTDLEPDDVFALAILFEEANHIYQESFGEKYPIDLIIVGEGNTTIKRMRLEKLLQEHFNIPPGVSIEIVESRATADNIFTYDGLELFKKEELEGIPFPDDDNNQAVEALQAWMDRAEKPLIIQLQPAYELVHLDADLASKTSVLFYGSFNLRKTALDRELQNHPELPFGAFPTISAKLEALMSHFSKRFSKIAILESFGVLGEQSNVSQDFEWTHQIGQMIVMTENKFLKTFANLTYNWNIYMFSEELMECEKITLKLIQEETVIQEESGLRALFVDLHADFVKVRNALSQDLFQSMHRHVLEHTSEIEAKLSEDLLPHWKTLIRNLDFAKKVSSGLTRNGISGVQFTLADVLVALATTDHADLFQAVPIRTSYNASGFLVPTMDLESNIVHYQRVGQKEAAYAIERFLSGKTYY